MNDVINFIDEFIASLEPKDYFVVGFVVLEFILFLSRVKKKNNPNKLEAKDFYFSSKQIFSFVNNLRNFVVFLKSQDFDFKQVFDDPDFEIDSFIEYCDCMLNLFKENNNNG